MWNFDSLSTNKIYIKELKSILPKFFVNIKKKKIELYRKEIIDRK